MIGVIGDDTMTHMNMVKTQVYLPAAELKRLHAIARQTKRKVADLVREAIRAAYPSESPKGPVALCRGVLRGTSSEHDAAFDEP